MPEKVNKVRVNKVRMISTLLLALTVLTAGAQQRIAQQRIPCVRNIPTDVSKTRGILGYPATDWDSEKIYRQAVILISFSDQDFSMDDPAAYYNRVLNEPGYNEGYGAGCAADYFRDQSNGLFNLQFDVYGPFKVSEKVKGGNNNYGDSAMEEALEQLKAATDADFSVYDWDSDGQVNQMVFIAAGFTGNQMKGYIWPNTSYSYFKAPGDIHIGMASISCEMWKDSTPCGIGTICHEFAHCLGLPDIYPTGSSAFSVVDEWDLMDGGNYTNKGWCPPNFSATERMLLGWMTPTELTEPTTITGMKPLSEGGETFIIRNSGNADEYYMLEHRRQTKWDYGIPGEGLAIFHVDFDREMWSNNQVNSSDSHYHYDLFHADGKDYRDWDPGNDGKDMGKYSKDDWMRNRYLSTSPYPYYDEELDITNLLLTNYSYPAATLFHENTDGRKYMSKPVTEIRMSEDGTISFDFMKDPVSVAPIRNDNYRVPVAYYDLYGRRLKSPNHNGICIIRYSDGTIRKQQYELSQ